MKYLERFDTKKLNCEVAKLENYNRFVNFIKFYESHGKPEVINSLCGKVYYKFLLIQGRFIKFITYDSSKKDLYLIDYILETEISNMPFNERLKMFKEILQEIHNYRVGKNEEVFETISRYLYKELFYHIQCKHFVGVSSHTALINKKYIISTDNIEEETRIKEIFRHYLTTDRKTYIVLSVQEEDLSSFELLWNKFLNGDIKYKFPAKMQILYIN